jgi:ATP-dependent RNA helicase RhlE
MFTRNKHARYPRYAGRTGFRSNSGNRRFSQKSLDISLLIHKAEEQNILPIIITKQSFNDFNLDERILKSIVSHGYTVPTPIQDQAIESIMQNRDLLGIANTGTGKTGAFLIPLINRVLKNPSHKILILAPTRELAIQINQEFIAFAATLNLWSVLCIGGANIHQQKRGLSKYFNFLIATPGRLKDLTNQKAINLSMFNVVVLDEVDRMLDMGFIHDVKYILNLLPQQRQSLFFQLQFLTKF